MDQVTPALSATDTALSTHPVGDALPTTPAGPSVRRVGWAAPEALRGDIQGLRAVAVLVVLLFHFWPGLLSGGYVGVDVFFVISGFLISGHLLRSPPRSPRGLAEFWARRIRRLLPAASLVLGATLLASLAWLPSTQLPTVARETIASAFYVENWALARSATDYLAADAAPSPLQHYWSLSVEEQFYVLWPLLIALLALLARGRKADRWWTAGLLLVTGGSLAASVVLTREDPAAAYFVTQTRVWELGLGSVVALAVHHGWSLRNHAVRAFLAWAGLAAIICAAVRFNGSTPFPGWAALVPTVGAAMVIAADGDTVRWSPRGLLGWRPSQMLGDISYSVYLWHWPIIVIAPFALGHELTRAQKLGALGAVVLVAVATKRLVEDPVRRSRVLTASLPRSFAIAAASALVLGTAGVAVIQRADASRTAQAQELAAKVASSDCVGAAAMREPGCTSIAGAEMLSSPAVARDDRSVLYEDGCWSGRPYTRHRICTYGDPDSGVKVALIGNSHAGHWFPALEPIAEQRNWRLDTYLVSQCYTVTTIRLEFGSEQLTDNCTSWNHWALGAIARADYDLVVMSNRTFQQVIGTSPGQKGRVTQQAYAQTLRTITANGTPVLVLRDIPSAIDPAPDCVAGNLGDVEACSHPAERAVEADPLFDAARADTSGLVSTLDLTNRFCRDGRCHVVIGGLIAYFDHGHMTSTFARTLVPDVQPAVDRALSTTAP